MKKAVIKSEYVLSTELVRTAKLLFSTMKLANI